MNRKAIAVCIGIMLAFAPAPAPAPALAGGLKQEDPLEPRLKSIAVQLRCPVCQGETIYDSHSSVATQMKALIKEKVSEGKTDTEILAFFVERYGEFVLMEPSKSGSFLLIWLFPGLALLAGSALAVAMLVGRQAQLQPAAAAVADTGELIRRIERLEP